MRPTTIGLTIAVLLAATCAHAALETGKTPPPLLVKVLAGDGAGHLRAAVIQQGPHPYVVVFAQAADDDLAYFIQAFDAFVTSQEDRRLAGYVVLCSDTPPAEAWLAAVKESSGLKHVSVCVPTKRDQIAKWQPHPDFPTNAWFFSNSVLVRRWVASSPRGSNLAGRLKTTIARMLTPRPHSESSGCNCAK